MEPEESVPQQDHSVRWSDWAIVCRVLYFPKEDASSAITPLTLVGVHRPPEAPPQECGQEGQLIPAHI